MAWFFTLQGAYVSGFQNSISLKPLFADAVNEVARQKYQYKTVIFAIEISKSEALKFGKGAYD